MTVDQAREGRGRRPASPRPSCRSADTPTSPVRTSTILQRGGASGSEDELGKIGGTVEKIDDQTIGSSLGRGAAATTPSSRSAWRSSPSCSTCIRFKWTFGVAAVLAMAHDVILVVGLFAWLRSPDRRDLPRAAMTIVGLSVNDTVVVFDRIRERWWGSKPEDDFKDISNRRRSRRSPDGQHRPRLDVHPGRADDPRWRLAPGTSRSPCSWPRGGTFSSVFVATPAPDLLQRALPDVACEREKVERTPEDSGAFRLRSRRLVSVIPG